MFIAKTSIYLSMLKYACLFRGIVQVWESDSYRGAAAESEERVEKGKGRREGFRSSG